MRTPERIEQVFLRHPDELSWARDIALKIRSRIETVDALIEQHSSHVCAQCGGSCCKEKYSFYNSDDLVYIHALGLKPKGCESRDYAAPCHFLKEDGCTLDRAVRPSGCNWHFCDTLLESISISPGEDYANFDRSMEEIMLLWIELMQEFRLKFREFTGQEMHPDALVCASDITPLAP